MSVILTGASYSPVYPSFRLGVYVDSETVRDLVVNRQTSLPGVVARELVERNETVSAVALEAGGDLQLVGRLDVIFSSNGPLIARMDVKKSDGAASSPRPVQA
jgi:hypothetical protein